MPFGAVDLGLALVVIWLAVLAAVAFLFVHTWWRERRGRPTAVPINLALPSATDHDPLPF